MTTYQIVTAISSLISIAGLWIILFWLYRDYRTDHFRQSMFTLRDELFDAAAEGKIAFDDPAYGLLRTVMNGFIRFGHSFTLLGFLLVPTGADPNIEEDRNSFSARWERTIRDRNPEEQEYLQSMRMRMNLIFLRHITLRSPILVLSLIVPLFGLAAIQFCLTAVLRVLRSPLDRVDTVALAEGA